jgi:UDP:flavonoid glycosyltransferase YjiC (YdhE family)
VARRLGVPHATVTPHHALVPARALAALQRDPRVKTSRECLAAVRRLREVHGLARANPFSYVEELSPHLNLYCEPREFLDEADRAAFEPLAFFGALAPGLREGASPPLFRNRARTRIYVSFGTVIWWYFEALALAALRAIAADSAALDADVVISIAGHALAASTRAEIERKNVRIVDYADQWQALREADVFVTHHGINSTHEAIYHQVPMLSYPFIGDQPLLARRCQQLGLALPLSPEFRGPIAPGALAVALRQLAQERESVAARLAEARSWELRTLAERPAAVERLVRLADNRRP